MSEATDDWEMAVYPPQMFLEPWTLRRLRRLAWGLDDLGPLIARLLDQEPSGMRRDPVVAVYLNGRASDWATDTLDCAPQLQVDAVQVMCRAALDLGYRFGRLLVGTADQPQAWSDQADRAEAGDWLDRTMTEIDSSACWSLAGADETTVKPIRQALDDVVAASGLADNDETTGRAWVLAGEGLCVALVEHSVARPVAEHVMVDLTVIGDLLPESVIERAAIAEALGCLLTRLDDRGRCSECELRDAADELGGERGHRYFRQFRAWGLVDYTLTERGTGTVRVRRHRDLRGGPPTT